MSTNASTTLQLFWQDASIDNNFRCGVSLHSHTMYSEESLDIIPSWMVRAPYLRQVLGAHLFNPRDGFWTPPLTPRQAYRLEQKQIERSLQLPALVSLTDHDDVRAGTFLRVMDRFRTTPISTEWTVPFGPAFFHVGIHNLSPVHAPAIMERLSAYTRHPQPQELPDILAMLADDLDILVVLNHPLWDEKGTNRNLHLDALRRLLEQHGQWIHALEVNGLRSWEENQHVLRLGKEGNWPVVAGGDRHGLEPNAILNLTCATNLPEFIREVREQRQSHVVFMPQYRQPRRLRFLHTVVDVLRDYPENFEGRRSWGDRVFYRDRDTATPVPLRSVFGTCGTQFVKHFLSASRLVDRRSRSAVLTGA